MRFSFPKAPTGAFVALFHVELRSRDAPPVWGDLEERPRCPFCNGDSWVVATEKTHVRVSCRRCEAKGPARRMPRSVFPSKMSRALLDAVEAWLKRPRSERVDDDELRRCPHCATYAGLHLRHSGLDRPSVAVQCDACGAQGPTAEAPPIGVPPTDPRLVAVWRWNERAGDELADERDEEHDDETEDET